MEKFTALVGQLEDIFIWLFLFGMFFIGAKNKFEWVTSVRSLITIIITLTFCDLAFDGKIDPKDFLLIVSLVYNFYFMLKKRAEGEEKKV